jgi:hypothetical protein
LERGGKRGFTSLTLLHVERDTALDTINAQETEQG